MFVITVTRKADGCVVHSESSAWLPSDYQLVAFAVEYPSDDYTVEVKGESDEQA